MNTNYERFEYPNYAWCDWDEMGRNALTDELIQDFNFGRPIDPYLVYLLCHEVQIIRMRSNNLIRIEKRLRDKIMKLENKS
jgi:hypothetical protein